MPTKLPVASISKTSSWLQYKKFIRAVQQYFLNLVKWMCRCYSEVKRKLKFHLREYVLAFAAFNFASHTSCFFTLYCPEIWRCPWFLASCFDVAGHFNLHQQHMCVLLLHIWPAKCFNRTIDPITVGGCGVRRQVEMCCNDNNQFLSHMNT